MAREPTHEVYLDTSDLPIDVTSPVRTAGIKYYDAGIWIDRERDRVFVPYRRVQLIREVAERHGSAERSGDEETPTGPPHGPPTEPSE